MQLTNILQTLLAFAALTTANPIESRDTVKLNQYRTRDDCNADRDILYHTAPVSGRCYPLDDATGAYFLNTGGFLLCVRHYSTGGGACLGGAQGFPSHSGSCYDREDDRGRVTGITCM